jgi:hypothetical protein
LLFEPKAIGPRIARSFPAETVGKVVGLVKLEMSLFAGLLVIGTTLLARVQVQGVEGALVSTALEYGLRGLRAAGTVLRKSARCIG